MNINMIPETVMLDRVVAAHTPDDLRKAREWLRNIPDEEPVKTILVKLVVGAQVWKENYQAEQLKLF